MIRQTKTKIFFVQHPHGFLLFVQETSQATTCNCSIVASYLVRHSSHCVTGFIQDGDDSFVWDFNPIADDLVVEVLHLQYTQLLLLRVIKFIKTRGS